MATLFVEPGRLNTELLLQAPSDGPDGMGGLVRAWSEVATVFGRIEPVSQARIFGAGQTLETLSHRITIRHRTIHDPDESGRYLVCRVMEEGA
jgi:SPP1 family predicted phage head-tail adaptor